MASPIRPHLVGFFALLSLLLFACAPPERPSTIFTGKTPVSGEKAPTDRAVMPDESVTENTDIHFNARYCQECHTIVPSRKTGEKFLRYGGDYQKLCRCHYPETGPMHTHPVDILPTEDETLTVPKSFPLQEGKMTCISCHDIFVQCRDSESDRLLMQGQMLLRGLPYDKRIDFCFRCHDKDRYQKYNPHKQIDPEGNVIKTRCLYCHAEAPDSSQTTWEDVQLIGGFTELCMGCHYQAAKQPLHERHLRRPSEPILARMKLLQIEFNIVLPLDRKGMITCSTCHNPHQKGLIPDQRAGATGAGAAHRHRIQDNLCIKCHPMQSIDSFGS